MFARRSHRQEHPPPVRRWGDAGSQLEERLQLLPPHGTPIARRSQLQGSQDAALVAVSDMDVAVRGTLHPLLPVEPSASWEVPLFGAVSHHEVSGAMHRVEAHKMLLRPTEGKRLHIHLDECCCPRQDILDQQLNRITGDDGQHVRRHIR
eukprot:300540-Prymnesium_polylepis.1